MACYLCYCHTGFLIKSSILDIRQGSEYALISEYTRVVNILGFWICQGYTRFWIKYFMIDIWQYYEYALDSEYARVLNMQGSHMVLNKISHNAHFIRSNLWVAQNERFIVNLKFSILVSLKARKMNSSEPSPLPNYL